MTVKTEQPLQDGGTPNTRTTIEQHGAVRFLWAKVMAAKDIHKEMLPMYGEHCLLRQKQQFSGERFPDDDAVE